VATDTTALTLFREKAKELESSIFVQSIANSGSLSTSIKGQAGEALSPQRTGPTEDEIRSSVLTIRLFCQDNDRISIRKTATFVNSLTIDQQIKDEYARWRSELKDFLDAPTSTGFDLGNGPITRRFLFETFLYGFYAHLEDAKLKLISDWRGMPFFADMKMEFDIILLKFTQAVARLSRTVEKVEAAIAGGGPADDPNSAK
jgi:hypothetical protein